MLKLNNKIYAFMKIMQSDSYLEFGLCKLFV